MSILYDVDACLPLGSSVLRVCDARGRTRLLWEWRVGDLIGRLLQVFSFFAPVSLELADVRSMGLPTLPSSVWGSLMLADPRT